MVDQVEKRGHDRERHAQNRQLQVGDFHPAEVDSVVREEIAVVARKANGLLAHGQENKILEKSGDADRAGQRGEDMRPPQLPVGDAFIRVAVAGGENHRHEQAQPKIEQDVISPRHREDSDRVDAGEHPDHEDFTVREIDHAQHAVNHGVAESDQRVDRPAGDSADENFRESRSGTHAGR